MTSQQKADPSKKKNRNKLRKMQSPQTLCAHVYSKNVFSTTFASLPKRENEMSRKLPSYMAMHAQAGK